MENGFAAFEGVVDTQELLDEACRMRQLAARQDVREEADSAQRGGKPQRSFATVSGGPAQRAYYHAPWLISWLSELVGRPLVPTGPSGSYTFYDQPGDHLDIHRDIEGCDITVISCLYDDGPPDSYGGSLELYPGRTGESLEALRAAPDQGVRCFHLSPGQTLVLAGGLIPHRLVPVAPGQKRIVSLLCYRAQSPDA